MEDCVACCPVYGFVDNFKCKWLRMKKPKKSVLCFSVSCMVHAIDLFFSLVSSPYLSSVKRMLLSHVL